ncbi:MAG: SGNH/GDSL hydrolase family protein [Gemmatimonadaceae bacterium]
MPATKMTDSRKPGIQKQTVAFRVLHALRDGWLIVGIALLLLLGLEAAYRGQAAARRLLRGMTANEESILEHPYASESWYGLWERREGARGGGIEYDPYRGWWAEPYEFPLVNVDSAGHRVTPQPRRAGAAPTRRLVMLGGSTMWGYTARDSFTIPALVAERLEADGIPDVEVVNLAQPAYTLTQGLITLLLDLRAGVVPDAAVFLDGNNEIATTFESGEAGRVLGERLAEERLRLGGRGMGAELLGLTRHSELIGRVLPISDRERTEQSWANPEPERVCDDVAAYYRRLVAMGEALGREFGFSVHFFWQPLRATTGKPLTAWEAAAGAPAEYGVLLRRCTAAVDSVMADRRERTYFPLHALFDEDTATVFLDDFGHVTERANGIIADEILRRVGPILGRPTDRHSSTSGR